MIIHFIQFSSSFHPFQGDGRVCSSPRRVGQSTHVARTHETRHQPAYAYCHSKNRVRTRLGGAASRCVYAKTSRKKKKKNGVSGHREIRETERISVADTPNQPRRDPKQRRRHPKQPRRAYRGRLWDPPKNAQKSKILQGYYLGKISKNQPFWPI